MLGHDHRSTAELFLRLPDVARCFCLICSRFRAQIAKLEIRSGNSGRFPRYPEAVLRRSQCHALSGFRHDQGRADNFISNFPLLNSFDNRF